MVTNFEVAMYDSGERFLKDALFIMYGQDPNMLRKNIQVREWINNMLT